MDLRDKIVKLLFLLRPWNIETEIKMEGKSVKVTNITYKTKAEGLSESESAANVYDSEMRSNRLWQRLIKNLLYSNLSIF